MKMETMKTQEQEQSYSSGDSDVSRCSSTPVVGKDEQISKGRCDSGTKINSKKEEKRSISLSSLRDLSSSSEETEFIPHIPADTERGGRSRSSDSHSQSRRHDQKNRRKHHGRKE